MCALDYKASPTWLGCMGHGSSGLLVNTGSVCSSTGGGVIGVMGVMRDSAVRERLWVLDMGEEVVVKAGDSKSVVLVHREVSETARWRTGGAQV